jgi:hypothetical protein
MFMLKWSGLGKKVSKKWMNGSHNFIVAELFLLNVKAD